MSFIEDHPGLKGKGVCRCGNEYDPRGICDYNLYHEDNIAATQVDKQKIKEIFLRHKMPEKASLKDGHSQNQLIYYENWNLTLKKIMEEMELDE